MKLRVECSTDTTDSACKQPLESVEVRLHRWMCENVEKQSKVSAVESRAFRVRCRIGNIPACAFEMLQKRSHYLSGAWQGLHSANHGAVEPKQKPIVTVVTLKASKVGANNSCQPRSNFFGTSRAPTRPTACLWAMTAALGNSNNRGAKDAQDTIWTSKANQFQGICVPMQLLCLLVGLGIPKKFQDCRSCGSFQNKLGWSWLINHPLHDAPQLWESLTCHEAFGFHQSRPWRLQDQHRHLWAANLLWAGPGFQNKAPLSFQHRSKCVGFQHQNPALRWPCEDENRKEEEATKWFMPPISRLVVRVACGWLGMTDLQTTSHVHSITSTDSEHRSSNVAFTRSLEVAGAAVISAGSTNERIRILEPSNWDDAGKAPQPCWKFSAAPHLEAFCLRGERPQPVKFTCKTLVYSVPFGNVFGKMLVFGKSLSSISIYAWRRKPCVYGMISLRLYLGEMTSFFALMF